MFCIFGRYLQNGMNLYLKDKVIVISGGSKGIGRSISQSLVEEGAFPIIITRNRESAVHFIEKLEKENYKADYFITELSTAENCKNAIEKIVEKYGRIDGLVNNAGVNDGVGLESGSYERFVASLHKNLIHYYLLAHYALPFLKKSRGSIINIGSKTATTGQGGTSAYAAANGGRNALTREWAVELLPYGIRVNSVIVAECYTPLYESWIQTFENPKKKLKTITDKIPLEKRMTTGEEIAHMVVFLLSEKSSHTTGQLIYVDGGYTHLDRALI